MTAADNIISLQIIPSVLCCHTDLVLCLVYGSEAPTVYIDVTERSGQEAVLIVYSFPGWNRTTSVPKSVPRGGFG